MPNASKTTVAVIVPATNRPPTLGACLAAIEASERQPDELVVIDDLPGAGPAAARNAGAERSRADLLAFVDADVTVHPDALGRLVRAFDEDRELAALFGSYDDSPADPGTVSRFRNLLHHHVHASEPGEAETFWAGLGAVRREAFTAAGGFDAQRFSEPSVEDIDLGMRLRAAGRRIELDPEIRATHLKRWTVASMLKADFARRGVPWTRLLLERGGDSTALNLSVRNRLSALAALAAAVAALARRPLGVAVAGATLAALNRRFYALLARRGGLGLALAGLPLHVLHQLAAVASVPVAVLAHLREGRR